MGKVFIAAGHHPKAPGAGFEGFYEHDEADRWLDVMFALDLDGRVLVRVPTGPLKDKAEFINRNSEPGLRLADACQEVLAAAFPPSRGLVAGWYRGDQSRGAYYFLERVRCPSVILEPEFINHRDLIQSKRAEVAPALAVALAAYVGEKL